MLNIQASQEIFELSEWYIKNYLMENYPHDQSYMIEAASGWLAGFMSENQDEIKEKYITLGNFIHDEMSQEWIAYCLKDLADEIARLKGKPGGTEVRGYGRCLTVDDVGEENTLGHDGKWCSYDDLPKHEQDGVFSDLGPVAFNLIYNNTEESEVIVIGRNGVDSVLTCE